MVETLVLVGDVPERSSQAGGGGPAAPLNHSTSAVGPAAPPQDGRPRAGEASTV